MKLIQNIALFALLTALAFLTYGCNLPVTPQEQTQIDEYQRVKVCLDSLWRADSTHANVWRIPACKFK